jgi:hypothetical protein
MTEFSVRLANTPGQLAALARLFAGAGVEIEALAAVADNGQSHVRIVVEQAATARRLLMNADMIFDERDVLDTFIPRGDGGLAAISESLAHAGVNVESMYLLHTNAEGFHVAMTVSDTDLASQALAPRK